MRSVRNEISHSVPARVWDQIEAGLQEQVRLRVWPPSDEAARINHVRGQIIQATDEIG